MAKLEDKLFRADKGAFFPYIMAERMYSAYNNKTYLYVRIDFNGESMTCALEVPEEKIDLKEDFGKLLVMIGNKFGNKE